MTFPKQPIDGVRVTSRQGLTSYRIEAWQNGWWHNVAELDTYSQNEIIDPIAYPEGTFNVKLSDWSDWDFLPDNFAGVINYRTSVELSGDSPCRSAKLILDKFSGSVCVFVNGLPVGAKMFAPFDFDVGNALRNGLNEIELRVSNTIVSNVSGRRGGITKAVLSRT